MSILQPLLAIQKQLRETPHLLRLGKLFSTTILIQIDADKYFLTFDKGVITLVDMNPSKKMPWCFAFRTDAEALSEFWRPFPKAGFHDIFGLVKIGRAEIEGDIIMLIKNLRFFKETLALGRSGQEC